MVQTEHDGDIEERNAALAIIKMNFFDRTRKIKEKSQQRVTPIDKKPRLGLGLFINRKN